MSDTALQLATIARKEVADASRTKILAVVTAFMIGAGLIALLVAAMALKDTVAEYEESRALLLSMGKSVDALVPPAYDPLKLLRGFIEYIEIIGAILGIVLGHRAAASERGRNTLQLLLTRPMPARVLLLGKCAGNLAALTAMVALVFALGALAMTLIGGVHLTLVDMARMLASFVAAALYVGMFFLLGFILALTMRRPALAILAAFAIWLLLVLIAPQIGDTLDPDNQVGAGVFRTLGIAKPQEKEILKTFATYETVRDSIEQLSPAKHFERWSFAVLGIKEIYNGQPLLTVMQERERRNDFLWLLGLFSALAIALFSIRLDITKLSKE